MSPLFFEHRVRRINSHKNPDHIDRGFLLPLDLNTPGGYTFDMFKGTWTVPASIVLSLLLVGFAFVYRAGTGDPSAGGPRTASFLSARDSDDILNAIDWAKLERELVIAGVIDPEKFDQSVRTELNLLWAFGLANENRILTQGPMMDPQYGGAGGFASTGGWTLARQNLDGQNLGGQARGSVMDPVRSRARDGVASPSGTAGAATSNGMDHYAMHRLVTLTEDQQELVERVAKNIYRPCCGNSTYFPDCNHGMAMLGLLELLAANGVDEDKLYRAALAMNRQWFPDTYDAIDRYLTLKNMRSADENPKIALSYDFSSAEGYARVLAEVVPSPASGGGSCGV